MRMDLGHSEVCVGSLLIIRLVIINLIYQELFFTYH